MPRLALPGGPLRLALQTAPPCATNRSALRYKFKGPLRLSLQIWRPAPPCATNYQPPSPAPSPRPPALYPQPSTPSPSSEPRCPSPPSAPLPHMRDTKRQTIRERWSGGVRGAIDLKKKEGKHVDDFFVGGQYF